ncbi:MAG: AAA family ATPase [Methylococcales bacterium]|nr:AAA family ATPase [Methylococcales bacterium]
MAQEYYTSEHFQLLNKWKGQSRDESILEQNRAYKQLKVAYEVTANWATQLQKKLFPDGYVEVRRRPTNQQNNFLPYNWARIFPQKTSLQSLAYTVGITVSNGFFVKLDLVDSRVKDRNLRPRYLDIRGNEKDSPIVSILTIDEGLEMSLTDLVDWSADAIKNFKLSYDDVAQQLGLIHEQDDQSLLAHFKGHKDFIERQPLWPETTTTLFCRLALAVNEMGLDWWFTQATNSQLRFGRKEKSVTKGNPVGHLFLRKDGVRVNWNAFASLEDLDKTDISEDLVQSFEDADKMKGDWPAKLGQRSGRDGYWPDEYDIEDEDADKMKGNWPDDFDIEDQPTNNTPPKNTIYYGPPGTGKTFELQGLLQKEYTDSESVERYAFVTFHQSYGYEEFVEGLRPVITKRSQSPTNNLDSAPADGQVHYEIKPGAFLRLCEQARKNPSQQYAMVIDEINRGNISRIFGELITLVEVDKREGAKYPVTVTLPYSGEKFSIPSNVDVIGTMNTADRSLALVDTALRRRFEFIESMPKPDVLAGTLVSSNGKDINIERLLLILNRRIEALYDRDHTIGHAYFTRLIDLETHDRFEELKTIFRNRIIPLLEEYFFEDWQKIRLVLGDNQKSNNDHQFVHEIGREDDLVELFGSEHELDQYSIRSRYQLNTHALDLPDSYIGIYTADTGLTG